MTESDPFFQVCDFAAVLCQEPRPLLVAGQAVNLWALVYSQRFSNLARMQPFVSRDCDLFGDAETLTRLANATGWKSAYSPKRAPSPVVGLLTGSDASGRTMTVDVLSSVRGLSPSDLEQDAVVELDGKLYRVLTPVILLKAKLANVIDLPQERPGGARTDLEHVKILVPCIVGYLTDAHQRGVEGILTDRGLINLFEETLKVVTSENAQRVSSLHKLDLFECFPPELNASPIGKVQNFFRHRLIRLRGDTDTP